MSQNSQRSHQSFIFYLYLALWSRLIC
jgi:hypothetical protein